jgi:hypothetical protein
MGTGHSPRLKLTFVVSIVSGAGLLVVLLGFSQVSASRAGDKLDKLVPPVVTPAALHRLSADLNKAESVSAALREVGLPRLAALSARAPSAFQADLTRRYPAFAGGVAQLPAIQRTAEKVVTNLERRRGQIDSAASLPGLGLNLNEAVWGELAIGVLLIVVGIAGLARPRREIAAAIGAIGLLLVALPLALGNLGKAADSDALLGSLRPFSVQKVRVRRADLATARLVFSDFRGQVVPYVAAAAYTTPAAVEGDLGAASPQLSRVSLHETDGVLDLFGTYVALPLQPLLVKVDRVSPEAATWLVIIVGAALMFGSALGLIGARAATTGPRR